MKFVRFFYFAAIFLACSLNAEESGIERLMRGNKRYLLDKLKNPNRSPERRLLLASSQEPFAVIVGCSDSRVSPEVLFDQGMGDLFVVRVAGNVIGPLGLESILYSVFALHSSLILVLGHENCGAVKAVLQGKTSGIERVAKLIEPALQEAKRGTADSLLVATIKDNAIRMRELLLKNPKLQKLVSEKRLEIYAGYFHLESGEVELLD